MGHWVQATAPSNHMDRRAMSKMDGGFGVVIPLWSPWSGSSPWLEDPYPLGLQAILTVAHMATICASRSIGNASPRDKHQAGAPILSARHRDRCQRDLLDVTLFASRFPGPNLPLPEQSLQFHHGSFLKQGGPVWVSLHEGSCYVGSM